jgi:UDP-N-acetylmuramate--alanine ligase
MKPSSRLRTLHFTGIGGSGMSALAAVMHGAGFTVSGSDRVDGATQNGLRAKGIPVFTGHAATHVTKALDALVYTAAVPSDNAELEAARTLGVPVVRRADLLGLVMARRHGLAVAGTHGKSTTTGMLIHILKAAGTDPGWAVGAAWKDPVSALVTNVDADHLDYYGTLGAIEDAFVQFLNGLPFHGIAVLNAEDAGLRRIAGRLTCRVRTCGLSVGDYQAHDMVTDATGASFILWRQGESLGRVTLRVFGAHNVTNALAAAALALEEGVPFAAVAEGLAAFPGMHRRLETVGTRNQVTVLDDYAHHPAEVAAALRAARSVASARGGRLVVVFQPHLYSRTRQLAADFAGAFLGCDTLFVLPVYAAREGVMPGVEGHLISDEATRLGHGDSRFLADFRTPVSAAAFVAATLGAGDVCVTMGAGDVGTLSPALLEALA